MNPTLGFLLLLLLALGPVHAQQTQEQSLRSLASPEPSEVEQALRQLQQGEVEWSPIFLAPVRELAQSSDSALVRMRASEVWMQQEPSDQAVRIWSEAMLKAPLEQVRVEGFLYQLRGAQKALVFPALEKSLADPERATALGPGIVEWMGEELLATPTPEVGWRALEAVMRAAQAKDIAVKSTALLQLGRYAELENVVTLLEAALQDNNPRVVGAAVSALAENPANDAAVRLGLRRLLEMAQRKSSVAEATNELASLRFSPLLPALIGFLGEELAAGNKTAARLLAESLTRYDQVDLEAFQRLYASGDSKARATLLATTNTGKIADDEGIRGFLSEVAAAGEWPLNLLAATYLYGGAGEREPLLSMLRLQLSLADGISMPEPFRVLQTYPELIPMVREPLLSATVPKRDDATQSLALKTLLFEQPVTSGLYRSVAEVLKAGDFGALEGLYGPAPVTGMRLLTPLDVDPALVAAALGEALAWPEGPERESALESLLYLVDPFSDDAETRTLVDRAQQSSGGLGVTLAAQHLREEQEGVLWSTTCAGKPLALRLRVAPTFQNVYTTPILEYGGRAVEVVVEDFRPYGPQVLAGAKAEIFDLSEETFELMGEAYPLPNVVVFLDPGQVSAQEFAHVAACLEQGRKEIAAGIRDNPVLRRYHQHPFKISGVVLGARDSFQATFRRNPNEAVEIGLYGQVVLVQREGMAQSWSALGEARGGGEGERPVLELSDRNVAPGDYRDSSGRSLSEAFEVRWVTPEP